MNIYICWKADNLNLSVSGDEEDEEEAMQEGDDQGDQSKEYDVRSEANDSSSDSDPSSGDEDDEGINWLIFCKMLHLKHWAVLRLVLWQYLALVPIGEWLFLKVEDCLRVHDIVYTINSIINL